MSDFLIEKIQTPVGPMILVAKDGVVLLFEFEGTPGRVERQMRARFGSVGLQPASNPFGLTDRIRAYFDGDIRSLEGIATDGGGTEFERQVWAELRQIPAGTTVSYGHIARKLGDVQLSRAVGTANGKNPISIIVPWHRVIGADGSMTGYGGGLKNKEWLLRHEGVLLI